ncbi:MAG: plasmid pRiA4b ORF-3 family protein [Chloroflexia bacterium]|nr:plasmid pRiA4b ORF-3 family protein [Chloroflexia bacterium]
MKESPAPIYQIKVILQHSQPPIWRRLLVHSDVGLDELHHVLQIVMGWQDYHLHQFIVGTTRYAPIHPDLEPMGELDERLVQLEQVASSPGALFDYEYDFGDSWMHTLLLEEILPPETEQDIPRCIEGRGACPPEDVGGVWGYREFLEALQDPDHPEHESYLEWIGGEFDPDDLELEEINRRLAQRYRDLDQLLWTWDEIVRWIDHPDAPVRRWAQQRLIERFPQRAGEVMVELVDDPNFAVAMFAADFLAKTGQGERYSPRLLQRLPRLREENFEYTALALAQLGQREVLPLLLERLERMAADPGRFGSGQILRILEALGYLGGEEARRILWQLHEHFARDALGRHYGLNALLWTALPEDILRLVRQYRTTEADAEHYLEAFSYAAGVERLAKELAQKLPQGLAHTLEWIECWLWSDLPWDEATQERLQEALYEQENAFPTFLELARQIVRRRGNDVAAWRADWEAGRRPSGYRHRTLIALLLLEALAEGKPRPGKLRDREHALGMALLAQLRLDRDDEAFLQAAEDKTAALLDILGDNRRHVLPDVIERVVERGPEIAPQVIERLDPEAGNWGEIRIAQAIAQLARRYPGCCDAAVPVLIESIYDDQGDYMLEACSEALSAIGPPAVAPIARRIREDDTARQIYLTGVLAEIPTRRSEQTLLDWIEEQQSLDEMHTMTLESIGSEQAIELLYEVWQEAPDFPGLAENLLVLCQLHGVEKAEMGQWRRRVREIEEQMRSLAFGPIQE